MVSAGSSEEDVKGAYLRLSGVHSWDSDLETVKCSYFRRSSTFCNMFPKLTNNISHLPLNCYIAQTE